LEEQKWLKIVKVAVEMVNVQDAMVQEPTWPDSEHVPSVKVLAIALFVRAQVKESNSLLIYLSKLGMTIRWFPPFLALFLFGCTPSNIPPNSNTNVINSNKSQKDPKKARLGEVRGKVVGIQDGDTITVLDGNEELRIRLAGIDAPEKNQDFGQVSKDNLSNLIFGKEIILQVYKTDRYGRLVAKVLLDSVDINLEQIKAGLAWHYKKYESEQEFPDRRFYSDAEVKARKSKAGLWAIPNPQPPWNKRKRV